MWRVHQGPSSVNWVSVHHLVICTFSPFWESIVSALSSAKNISWLRNRNLRCQNPNWWPVCFIILRNYRFRFHKGGLETCALERPFLYLFFSKLPKLLLIKKIIDCRMNFHQKLKVHNPVPQLPFWSTAQKYQGRGGSYHSWSKVLRQPKPHCSYY